MTATLKMPTKNKIEILITKEDIRNGIRNKPDCCPVALSLKRAGYNAVNVWGHRTSFLDPKTNEMIFRDLPSNLIDFIIKFDRKEKVSPHAFYI